MVLPYEEFLEVQEQLQDYEDLRFLGEAKEAEKNAATIGIDELKKKIGARTSRSNLDVRPDREEERYGTPTAKGSLLPKLRYAPREARGFWNRCQWIEGQ